MAIATIRATQTGTVGAYLTSGDVEMVRQVRDSTGYVTVSGRSGARVLTALAEVDDLVGVDFDPATYLTPHREDCLFEIDWVAR